MLSAIRKLANGLIRIAAIIGSVGLLVEVGVILYDVVGRFFGAPLGGAQDISQMSMVILVFGGMAVCDKVGGHISVDVFERSFPDWLNRWIDVFAAFLGAVIFAGIAWSVYESSKLSLMLNLATNVIYLPKAYFQWALSVFAVITALGMALRGVELALTGRDVRQSHGESSV
ncbi:TRAP transporter small permease [Mesobaculum littorinae]|uniref:TRAP transporter small permease protein n=1 Tax=Mesobaculum littorinae TaxID=2486419 RepID=A0A438AGS3_9RHOB|nr:TRAP transporter small permease subunit [Mesobaculum littorinae]RVV97894.1 TRAP transporter small permease [Mesobaculum littorinae]